MKRHSYLVSALCLLATSVPVLGEGPLPGIQGLEPLAVHPRATRFVVDQVRSNHLIRNQPLNDEASSEIFDAYLEVLDRRKNFLLLSDIQEFEDYRYALDDALKRGRLEGVFNMVNRLQLRRDERYSWVLKRLQKGIDSFDLYTDAELAIKSDELDWAADIDEANARWELNLIDAIIHMRLNERPSEEIQDLLTKRYTLRQSRNRQFTAEEAFATYINAFTQTYDPHTVYFSPRAAEDFHMGMRMSLEGIGALLGAEDEYVTVISLVKGGPAEQDGELKPAHRIVAVGQDVKGPMIDVVGRRVADVVDLIRGPRGTVVRLEVLEPVESGGESKIIDITRDKVKLEEATAKKKVFSVVTDGIERKMGVIELPKMYADLDGEQHGDLDYRSATRDVKRLIEELKDENIEGLIFDLRHNGGGSLEEAQKLVGLFIETGPTVLVKGMGRKRQTMVDNDPAVAYKGPLAVLVNRSSASASEIVAGAMQDYGRGLVVGSPTYGKGSVQVIQALNHGQLKVTRAKYYRISGQGTQSVGVNPDIEFPSLLDHERVGEERYDNALTSDSIDPAEYEPIADLSGVLGKLMKQHEQRIADDPLFVYYQRVEDRIEENREITHVSMNLDIREDRREENAEWRLKTENEYLIALGEEPVKTTEELDTVLGELPKKLSEEVDGMVKETGRILSDYILAAPTLAYTAQLSQ